MRAVQASLFCGLLALASAAKRPTLVSHGYAAHMNPAVMPLEGCRGDCDLDSHCKAGYKCHFQDEQSPIPGCEGVPNEGMDYCVRISGDCSTLPACRAGDLRVGCDAFNEGACTYDCQQGGRNCYVGAAGATWFGSHTHWSRSSFPDFPQEAHVPAKVVELTQDARGAAASLVLDMGGLLNIGPNEIELGPTTCRASEWEVSPLTATANRVCATITQCKAGEWETRAPTSTGDRACSPCPVGHFCPDRKHKSPCGQEDYQPDEGAVACKTRTVCSSTQWETNAPTSSSDRLCSSHTKCDAGQWEVKAAASHWDRICQDCLVGHRCPNAVDKIGCAAGTYQPATKQTACLPERTCTAQQQYETAAPTKTSNRECADLTVCTDGQYETTAAGSHVNRACKDCPEAHFCPNRKDKNMCGNDQFQSNPKQTACLAVTTCTPGQWMKSNKTPISDRVCLDHTTCDFAHQFETRAPGDRNDRVCTQLYVCAWNEYEIVAPTQSSDRICLRPLCKKGEWESKAPGTGGQGLECTPLTTCKDNEWVSQLETATTDRK